MSAPLITSILESMNREVLNKLDLVRKQIGHPGESGTGREHAVREFFRTLLPHSYGIDTGFVIDAQGAKSKQVDIVIYRDDYHPTLEIEGVKHFLVESVAAVIQVKASIDSKRELAEALSNIKSVKQLDRTNRGKNYVIIGSAKGPMLDPANFNHQIYGAIVTEDSMGPEILSAELLKFMRSNSRQHWPNWYADIRHFSATYGALDGHENLRISSVTNDAQRLVISDQASEKISPLTALAQDIISFLRVVPLVDFTPSDYMLRTMKEFATWPIDS